MMPFKASFPSPRRAHRCIGGPTAWRSTAPPRGRSLSSLRSLHLPPLPLQTTSFAVPPSPRALLARGLPSAFTGWANGPAPKPHVLRAAREILVSEPCPLPPEAADAVLRLHGARRVYPTAARLLSKELGLTADDRDELGRWKPTASAEERSRGGARPMSNVYSTDAARSRCISTRKLVADAVRARLAEVGGWQALDPSAQWDFLIAQGSEPSVASIEPDLGVEERD
jgi:hypothetical protein